MKKFFTAFIFPFLLTTMFFSGCSSNTVKQDGIIFERITVVKTDGTHIEGYSVAGAYEDITILEIPSEIKGLPVINFKDKAFANNSTIKEIVIPKSISRPTLNLSPPFSGCSNIEKITVPFSNFSGLFFYGGKSALNKRDRLPESLRYLYLTDDCVEIDTRDFYYCSSLREIHIPNSVKIIKDGTNLIHIGVNGNVPSADKFQDLPFIGCSGNLRIFCEAYSRPEGWGVYWNYIDSTTALQVVWGEY